MIFKASARLLTASPPLLLAALLLLPSCSVNEAPQPQPTARPSTVTTTSAALPPLFSPLTTPALHNAYRITDKVIGGAQPEGDASFKALHDLGIQTIISVDGATPDVEGAKKYGLRYVHLPIEYSGVTDTQGRAIARAIDELPGPIYVHCHHGKHRSAAALAVACVNNGSLPPEKAESVLKLFGTGENYKGLWRRARQAKPLDPETLRNIKVVYASAVKIPALADAMVKLDQRHDLIKLVQKAGWKTPTDHPDLDPPHEALQLQELLRELARTPEVQSKPADFQNMLAGSEQAASELQQLLSARPIDINAAEVADKKLVQSCVQCHKAYRD